MLIRLGIVVARHVGHTSDASPWEAESGGSPSLIQGKPEWAT